MARNVKGETSFWDHRRFFIYLIRHSNEPIMKIGIAQDPLSRLRELLALDFGTVPKLKDGEEYLLVGVRPNSNRPDETKLHRSLKAWRMKGYQECYTVTPESLGIAKEFCWQSPVDALDCFNRSLGQLFRRENGYSCGTIRERTQEEYPLRFASYTGSFRYSDEGKVFHGKLEGVRDLITFESPNRWDLQRAFKDAVDDYIAMTWHERVKMLNQHNADPLPKWVRSLNDEERGMFLGELLAHIENRSSPEAIGEVLRKWQEHLKTKMEIHNRKNKDYYPSEV